MVKTNSNKTFAIVSVIALIFAFIVLGLFVFNRSWIDKTLARFNQEITRVTVPNRGKQVGMWVVGQEYKIDLKGSKPFTYIFLDKEENFLKFSYADSEGKMQQTKIAADGFIVEVVKGTTREQLDALNTKYGAAVQFEYTYTLPGYYALKIPDTKNVIDVMNAYSKEGIIAKVEADNAISLDD